MGISASQTRLHTECLAGNVFRSSRCACRPRLEQSLRLIAAEGCGVIVHIRRRRDGTASPLAVLGHIEPDDTQRTTGIDHPAHWVADAAGAQIVADFGIQRVRLLADDGAEVSSLEANGVHVVARIPLVSNVASTGQQRAG